MISKERYPVAKLGTLMCALLKISPARICARAGLPADYLDHETNGVTAEKYFDLWNAGIRETKRSDVAVYFGQSFAHGPFIPEALAFACSANLESGAKRKAMFMPLVGPVRMTTARAKGQFQITLESAESTKPLPTSLAAFKLVYLVEMARTLTGEAITPTAAHLASVPQDKNALEAYLGVPITVGSEVALYFTLDDALKPFYSMNSAAGEAIETELLDRLATRERDKSTSDRVRNALRTLLPGGESSVEAVCDRLHISRRSLQRYLKNEGQTFQEILDTTRTDMSLSYLTSGDISIEEISYLVGFQDPNSFYRAFQTWTGKTPMQVRGQKLT